MKFVPILVSPKGASNVGGVARLVGNFSLSELRIVEPRCDLLSLECKQMSMQGFHYVESAKIYKSLSEAQADLDYSVAFSGRRYEDNRPRLFVDDFAEKIPQLFTSQHSVGLVFGREEWGLTLDEIDLCDFQVEIPTSDLMPSINLTSAVSIVLYLVSNRQKTLPRSLEREEKLRPSKMREGIFFDKVFSLLERVRFTNPQNPQGSLKDLRSMYHRADLSERDLQILFGVLACLELELNRADALKDSVKAMKSFV